MAIPDFVFDEDKDDKEKLIYEVKLTDIETNKVFYDKLTFIYLEMPKFNKNINDLKTKFEKWLYVLRNLNILQERPEKLQERVFKKLFKVAEISKFSQTDLMYYEDGLKYYRNLKNSFDTAREEGKKEGIQQAKSDIIKLMYQAGEKIEKKLLSTQV